MSNSCIQRKLRMLYNIPQPRIVPISPYESGYSKSALDMRRKAEILKYAGPQSTIKLNKLTKAERFSQIVRGFSPLQKSVRNNNSDQDNFCDSSMNQVLTTSSDVPGPPVYLYLDKSIPLYQYIPPATIFNESSETNTNIPFIFHPVSPTNDGIVSFIANNTDTVVYTSIGVLEILNIETSMTTFTLTIPYSTTTTTSITDSTCLLQVLLNKSPALTRNYVYSINHLNQTITVENITLYTTPGYFFEFQFFINRSVSINTSNTILTVE